MQPSTELTLESLVTLSSQDVEPYVMDWLVIADDDGEPAATQFQLA